MASISVCLIVKNEKQVIERILSAAKKFADEIIVVDTGSTDNTFSLAKKYTDKVYPFTWVNDFSKARNYSFSLATCDYLMWLDADDDIDEDNIKALLNLKETLSHDCYMLKYCTSFDENNNPSFFYYRERIVKRSAFPVWCDAIHEYIDIRGSRKYCDISIFHKKLKPAPKKRNLKIYENLIKNKTPFSPRMSYYYGRELYFNGKYTKAIKVLTAYLKEEKGFIENLIACCLDINACYKCLKKDREGLSCLFESFRFDLPRAEIACEIALYFFNIKNFPLAIYWYEYALTKKYDATSGAFIKRECYDLIPLLQLCVCYYSINNIEKAIYYNTFAGKLFPNNISYLHNKEFFDKLTNKDKV